MKALKRITFILIFIYSLAGWSQPLIDTTKTWNVYHCNGGFLSSCNTVTYKFFSDSIIGPLKYWKLYRTFDSTSTNWAFTALLREDTTLKRVFWRSYNSDDLLYDFKLNVGDTAKVVSAFGNTNCATPMIVDSIKYNSYFGTIRKQYYFNTSTFYGHKETWIEGIGNTWGLLDNNVYNCTVDYGPRLICYKENSSLKYFDSYFSKCYQTTVGIKERRFEVKNVSVYPNPSNGEINIASDGCDDQLITITNELGQVVFETSTKKRNLSFYFNLKGIFFITVKSAKSTSWLKIIFL